MSTANDNSLPQPAAGGPASSGAVNRPAGNAGAASQATCPRCAKAFACGANASSCWCSSLPAIDLTRRAPELLGRGCLCGDCLGAVVAEQLAA